VNENVFIAILYATIRNTIMVTRDWNLDIFIGSGSGSGSLKIKKFCSCSGSGS
jgi:hypothetical protein